MRRLLSADVHGQDLTESIPAGTDVVAGTPTAELLQLAELAGSGVGLWQMTPGVAVDVEADEVFLVLSGDGTLAFADGESIELRPGTLVRLAQGDRTRWTIRSTVRKLYLTVSD